jgi:cbb3-type cytochrome oxidase subunit 3
MNQKHPHPQGDEEWGKTFMGFLWIIVIAMFLAGVAYWVFSL